MIKIKGGWILADKIAFRIEDIYSWQPGGSGDQWYIGINDNYWIDCDSQRERDRMDDAIRKIITSRYKPCEFSHWDTTIIELPTLIGGEVELYLKTD